jgi:hypothetical protein
LRLVHGRVCKSIGVGVQRAANVLEGHAADFACGRRPARSGCSPAFFTLVAEHLLNEQQRVGADLKLPATMPCPVQRGEQGTVFATLLVATPIDS